MKKITLTFQIPATQEECKSLDCTECFYYPRGFCPGSLEKMKKLKINTK